MPVHNTADFIDECLDSIIAQTYTNWELIAVDDFSTDKSSAILNEWAAKEPRISVLKNSQKGIIPALELAFKNSKGNYISRMDADDKMPANKLELLMRAMPLDKKTIVTGMVQYFSDSPVSEGYKRYETWLNSLVSAKNHWQNIYRECVIASPNWLVHRWCFEECFGFESLKYPEDYDMVFKWFDHGFSIVAVPEVTHYWREHAQRTSRTVEAYQQKAFFQLKTNAFIKHHPTCNNFQLIGAGEKGKLVAAILIEHKIDFEWFDLNSTRFNTLILGKEIQDVDQIQPNIISILTVWPDDSKMQVAITEFIHQKGLEFGRNCWLF
jgi:glycosyltransferase involved in cell wall biosynthesis